MIEKLFPRDVVPAVLLVTAGECLEQARVDLVTEGATLLRHAASAQALVEKRIQTALTPRMMAAYADGWPKVGPCGGWYLMTGQVSAIDAISYTDADGVEQTLPAESYVLRERLGLCHLRFVTGATLPAIAADSEIIISLTAGYPAGECNDALKQAVLMLTSSLYDNRGTLPADAEAGLKILLAPFLNWLV